MLDKHACQIHSSKFFLPGNRASWDHQTGRSSSQGFPRSAAGTSTESPSERYTFVKLHSPNMNGTAAFFRKTQVVSHFRCQDRSTQSIGTAVCRFRICSLHDPVHMLGCVGPTDASATLCPPLPRSLSRTSQLFFPCRCCGCGENVQG